MTIKTYISFTQIVIIFLSYQTASHSGVYKWVDEKGQIHYTDQPNQPGAETFTIQKNTTTKPASSIKDTKDADSDKETAEDETVKDEAVADDEPKMVEIEPTAAEKKRYCSEAKADIASISSRGRMREINEKGEYIYLTEPQRQQRLSAAKKKKREFCR